MVVKLAKTLLTNLKRDFLAVSAQSELSRLSKTSEPLAHAIADTLKNEINPQEKAWIEKIEAKRTQMNSSTGEITFTDYGAGSSDVKFTEQESNDNRVITKTIGEVSRSSSKPYFWSLLLFKLVKEFKPSYCLELGTCVGISASYQAAALKLNQVGELVTLEGSKPSASVAMENIQDLGLDNVNVVVGRFQDTLDKTLTEKMPLDYAFIDGHHDEQATLRYFEQILPFLSKKALLIFDDISWSEGMKRAWKAIAADNRVKISVDLSTIGICVIDCDIQQKESFTMSLT